MRNEHLKKQCEYCEKPIIGRKDKRFCDTQCKSYYHNQNKDAKELLIQVTNQALRRNRKILHQLCPTGKATVRQSVLIDMGFNFSTFSGIYPSSKATYYLSYNYGFSPIIDPRGIKKVLIIQRQTYMQAFDPWKYLKS